MEWNDKKLWGAIAVTLVVLGVVIGVIVWITKSSRPTPLAPSTPLAPTESMDQTVVACKPLSEVCEKSSSGDYVLTCYYSTAADFLNYNNWRCYLGRSAYGHFNEDSETNNPNLRALCGGNGGQQPPVPDSDPDSPEWRPDNPDTYYPHCWEVDWFADKNGLLNGQIPEDYIRNAGAGWFEDPTSGFVSYSSGCRNLDKVVVEADELVELRAFKVPELDEEALGDGAPLFKVAAPRLESRQSFSEGGIFLIDVDHIPTECGVWPAFWLVGSPDSWNSSYPNDRQDWPNYGEIDIIEQVNIDSKNHTTLHTKEGCNIKGKVSTGGSIDSEDCAFDNSYTGCSVKFPDFSSRNVDRNGVYACEWIPTKEINYWFFPKGKIPDNIKKAIEYGDSVAPSQWDSQTDFWSKMDLSGGCSSPDFFRNMHMVLNTTFCGDWAGRLDAEGPKCNFPPEGCNKEIENFIETYKPYEPIPDYTWRINSVRVYQKCS